MDSRNRGSMIIAIIAGLLLFITGVNGVAIWITIKRFVTTHIVDNFVIQVVFAILIFIASLGGIAVIIGGLLIGKDKVNIGRLLIALGAGIGLIGLVFSIIIAVSDASFTISSFVSIGVIGLILSIFARIVAKE